MQEKCRAVQDENAKLQAEILKVKEELHNLDQRNTSLKKQTEVYRVKINMFMLILAVWLYFISVQYMLKYFFNNNLNFFYIVSHIFI